MGTIRDSLIQYFAARRALWATFYEQALALDHFVDLLEREEAEFISIDLSMRWAMAPKLVERATWGRRLRSPEQGHVVSAPSLVAHMDLTLHG
jgi:hypothetical protein